MKSPAESPWYKEAVIYELHVRAFRDSNADGIGDFPGLTSRLDYLKDLGVTALWLLPFYPSPLRDDGYDIADYTEIHPAYGTLRDFKLFLREAHARGLRVITELVLNHSSDQHAWFQRARRAKPGSRLRDFYVWSDTPDRFSEARVIFKDFEPSNWTWDPVAKAYFWHRFYSHQPDLNYDNPAVRAAVLRVLDFWLELGVDGMRLDAVPYLFEREGTDCENLPETHAFLKELRRHVDARYGERLFLAEANQWPEDAAAYFGSGDECHMGFHFPLMPRLFMATRMEDRHPIVDILEQTPAIPEGCQWALFLRNHDEMTLEMVTDEDRDYMYRAYARDPQMRVNLGIRRRLAPLLGNNRRKIELLKGLLLSLPGTPVLYYGDELGMGDNIYLGDRNGVRTPMQWSADRNAGFSRANPQRLYLPVVIDPEYHCEALNVEAQQANPHSLLWWTKRLLGLRRGSRALAAGSMEFLHPDNRKVLAFLRRAGTETVLVVANLSRFAQPVELDLRAWAGGRPVELFGRTEFPRVGERPYSLTLGPHGFYWFALEPARAEPAAPQAAPASGPLRVSAAPSLSDPAFRRRLEGLLPAFLEPQRWFGAKARRLKAVRVAEAVPVPGPGGAPVAHWLLIDAEFREGDEERYALALALVGPARAAELSRRHPLSVAARVLAPEGELAFVDAAREPEFCRALFDALVRRRRLAGEAGELRFWSAKKAADSAGAPPEPRPVPGEQSNSSIAFGERWILKLFRRVEDGVNPDLELGRFLAAGGFAGSPAVAGSIEHRGADGTARTLGVLREFVRNEGDAWSYTVDAAAGCLEALLVARRTAGGAPGGPAAAPVAAAGGIRSLLRSETPAAAAEFVGAYLESARMLGARTAELHRALARDAGDPDFAPEPMTSFYRNALYQAILARLAQALRLLRQRQGALPEPLRAAAEELHARAGALRERLRPLRQTRLGGLRIRCHGDLHLGQALYTGKDFAFIDFEGEPSRPLSARRIKASPLRDAAGMLRSFDYAIYAALDSRDHGPTIRPEDRAALEPWARFWSEQVGAVYLRAYRESVGTALVPGSDAEFALLLDAHLLEKTLYELSYELNHRPGWAGIPLQALVRAAA